jgi:hypothetical protein
MSWAVALLALYLPQNIDDFRESSPYTQIIMLCVPFMGLRTTSSCKDCPVVMHVLHDNDPGEWEK